jgi:hypothetical protein
MSKIFVSYRHVDPDQQLARQWVAALEAGGHSVFWDTKLKVGQRWADEIGQNLRDAQFFVVLVSEESMRSDMVREEVLLAHQLSKQPERAMTLLPIRIAYTGALPYDLAARLDPIQYTLWKTDADSARVTAEICAAVNSAQPLPRTSAESDTTIRRLFEATEKKGAPLPKAELRFEAGTLRLDSPFYVARPEDALVLGQVRSPGGVTVIIKGVRQMGKSSLLARAATTARVAGARVVHLDFQLLESSHLKDLDSLLRWMARRIADELRPTVKPDEVWSDDDGPRWSLSTYLETAVLTASPKPLVLLLDEVDRVFDHSDYCGDFFAMIRYWHNQRATRPDPWDRLNLIIAHSTEPSLWIQDIHQSPFNVGEQLRMRDFNEEEIAELNRRYGTPLPDAALSHLRTLLGGHPFLIRQAFDYLARHGWTFAELQQKAPDSDGPFGDHLKRYVLGLSRDQALKDAFKTILRSGQCAEESHFQRLSAVGLISGSERTAARPRCQLYADYFRKHL